jgi:hypothetical protein
VQSATLLQMWANYLALKRPLRAACNGRGGSLGHALLKTFISGFSRAVESIVSYVNVLFVF